jgi:multimeric flavodoxin WrbA
VRIVAETESVYLAEMRIKQCTGCLVLDRHSVQMHHFDVIHRMAKRRAAFLRV